MQVIPHQFIRSSSAQCVRAVPAALLSNSQRCASALITCSSQVVRPEAMAAMRATLVLMLLLGALVAAHGRPVSCENKCNKPVVVNGITIEAFLVLEVEVLDLIEIEVVDAAGVRLFGSYPCPADVTALVVVYEEGCVKVKVAAAVGLINKLLHTVLGLVLGLIKCVLY